MSRSPRRSKPVMEVGSGLSLTRQGERLALRPLTEDDVEAVASWYEGAEELRERLEDVNCGVLAITRCEDDSAIGVVEYRLGVPEDGWLAFDGVMVELGLRGLGLESEAVRLVEGEMAEKGRVDGFCARVDESNGLELYFWLRLGYRPARPGEDPWPGEGPNGIMSMVRCRLPGGRGGS